MSGWWKSLPNGLPNVVSPPKSGHRRAAKGMEFPWRCNVDTIAMDLKVSWEMSVKTIVRLCTSIKTNARVAVTFVSYFVIRHFPSIIVRDALSISTPLRPARRGWGWAGLPVWRRACVRPPAWRQCSRMVPGRRSRPSPCWKAWNGGALRREHECLRCGVQ